MDRILINDKVYSGDLIFEGRKENIEVSIYVLNPAIDKYLVLNKKNNSVQDFVVTGLHKIYEIIETVKGSYTTSELEGQVTKALQQMKSQCSIKNLKRINLPKLRDLIVSYYDANYHVFVLLGIKFPELMSKVEKEMA